MRQFLPLVLIGITVACSRSPGDAPRHAAAVNAATQEWVSATIAGDIPRLMSLMTHDVVLLPPGERPLAGTRVEGWFRWFYEVYTVTSMTATVDETVVTRDWAYVRGTYTMDRTAADEPATREIGTFVHLLRRQPDGAWKLARDIWNVTTTSDITP